MRIFIIFFNKLTINVIKTLTNNHIGFKLDNINKKLKIIQYQSIVDIFVSFDVFDNEFQNNNENQREAIFIIYKNIFNNTLNVKFNHRYREK